MADIKISELPIATSIASPDVVPVVQGGVTKKADVSLFGGSGSYLTANTARVDPSGNDSTGEVGDLAKPFKTAQAAVTALETAGPYTQDAPAVLSIPEVDSTEDITTSLSQLVIKGLSQGYVGNPALGIVTLTDDGTGDGGLQVSLDNVYTGDVFANNVTPSAGTLTLNLKSAFISGGVTTTGLLFIKAPYSTGMLGGATITPGTGKEVHVNGIKPGVNVDNFTTITAPGSDVYLIESYVAEITDAASISMQDSVIGVNGSGVTPTRTDFFMNPVNMDFSTLPTTEPSTVGSAWIDTTGGLNIVKVKL